VGTLACADEKSAPLLQNVAEVIRLTVMMSVRFPSSLRQVNRRFWVTGGIAYSAPIGGSSGRRRLGDD
jgi:hypothetical protein